MQDSKGKSFHTMLENILTKNEIEENNEKNNTVKLECKSCKNCVVC